MKPTWPNQWMWFSASGAPLLTRSGGGKAVPPFSLCSTDVPPKTTSSIGMPVSHSEGLFRAQGAGTVGSLAWKELQMFFLAHLWGVKPSFN